MQRKDIHEAAKKLGARGGGPPGNGGKERAKHMTPEKRSEIARKGGKARKRG